jgi:hypothetical protein
MTPGMGLFKKALGNSFDDVFFRALYKRDNIVAFRRRDLTFGIEVQK